MKLLFENCNIDIRLKNSPCTEFFNHALKHLQHVKIPFSPWDSPYFSDQNKTARINLINFAKELDIEVDENNLNNQLYLNYLHELFEKQSDGSKKWLDFHENIHILDEGFLEHSMRIDWREFAGPLIGTFDYSWTNLQATEIEPGDIYCKWGELGKNPYKYWKDCEPDNMQRLCELAKPWILFRPTMFFALKENNFLQKNGLDKFESWWSIRKEPWCQHWNIADWNVKNIFGVIKIGTFDDISLLTTLLENNKFPHRIQL